jgi:hypothetical protein
MFTAKHNSSNFMQACTIQFKILPFKAYPCSRKISAQAFNSVRVFNGSNYTFPSGGITKRLNTLASWRNKIRFKKLLEFKKFN